MHINQGSITRWTVAGTSETVKANVLKVITGLIRLVVEDGMPPYLLDKHNLFQVYSAHCDLQPKISAATIEN